MTEDEMFGWLHRHNGHKFEQSPGDSGEQGSLASCSPWSHKESDVTEQLNNSPLDNPLAYQGSGWILNVSSRLPPARRSTLVNGSP